MRAFSTASSLVLIGLTALSSTGCIEKNVVNTIFISPSAVAVSVLETEIRSDANILADRLREEGAFVQAANAEQHSTATDLRDIGALSVKTTWIRRERPYGLLTEAQFTDLRTLVVTVMHEAKVAGDVSVTHDGCDTIATGWIKVDTRDEQTNATIGSLDSDLQSVRFVLTEGRFTNADGFTLSDDGVTAVLDAKKRLADGLLNFSLRWTADGCVTR